MRSSKRSLFVLVLLVLFAGGASQWWFGRSELRLAQALAASAAPGDIRMLSSTTCVYCAQARDWMRRAQVPFDECFIERDAKCRAEFDARYAQGTPLVVVKGRSQRGFSPQRVLDALREPA